MLFGIYKLTVACQKYGFAFYLKYETYDFVEIELRNIKDKWRITLRDKTYRSVFKRAINKMKSYNKY